MNLKELYLNKIGGNFLLSRSVLVISSAMITNVFGYIFQVATGRYFSVEEYAVLISLMSLSVILGLVIQPLSGGITKLVAEIKDIDYPKRISVLYFSLLKVFILISISFYFLLSISTKIISSYLHLTDLSIIRTFNLFISVNLLFNFMTPFLQGLMRFKAYSFMQIMNACFRVLTALVVIYFSLGVKNIYQFLVVAILILGVTASIILRKNIINKFKCFNLADIKKLLYYSFGSTFAVVSINLIGNDDIILVKHYFDSFDAGIYSSVTVIGKIAYYAAIPTSIVMLPMIASNVKNKKVYSRIFIFSLLISIAISTFISLIFFIEPKLFVHIFFGDKHINASGFLPLYGVFSILYTILTLTQWFLIGISKFRLASIAVLSPIIQYIGIIFYHNSLADVINASIISLVIPLALIYIIILKKKYLSFAFQRI